MPALYGHLPSRRDGPAFETLQGRKPPVGRAIPQAAIRFVRRDDVDREQPVVAMMLDHDCLASNIFTMAALRLASSTRFVTSLSISALHPKSEN